MGWHNPPVPWSQLHRRLGGGPPGLSSSLPSDPPSRLPPGLLPQAAAPPSPRPSRVPYAELHCHSNFSFLDGASHPEELVAEAVRLGLRALALTDHDGLYGAVRFAEAARAAGLPAVFGAELSLGLSRPQGGVADPEGRHLVVLARDPEGYARLARAISEAQLAGGKKGRPAYQLSRLADLHGGHWLVLTGCRKGAVPRALVEGGPEAAARELAALCACFGRDNVAVELWDHGDPIDSHRNDALAALAVRFGVPVVATNNVHYHTPARRRLATALAAVRARRSLDEIDGWLPAAATAHLRSGAEMARLHRRYPGAVERAAELGLACAFDLRLIAPCLPRFPVPPGHSEDSWLRELVRRGGEERYGPPSRERVPGAWRQLTYELEVITSLGYAGYFLVVWDIVSFCRQAGILCQGRGSAANSAVCYALGITNADPVSLGLLFERFLSPARDGPPDIDVDIASHRREEVIQYVYRRYGREHAAQVCNVICYRPRSAVRDMAKALGYSPGCQDAFSKQVDDSLRDDLDIPPPVVELAREVLDFPRHLGIHSGGMVICDRPVVEVCPVEWARHEGRTVLQWDRDDCAAAGLVKFDLLGLGMLSAIQEAIELIRAHHGVEVDLATLPQEDAVYDMLCRADTVGVFQVESRAQMATLPRLQPRCFYDLVVAVALIRPGPIQGGSVHPYIRRRQGREPVTYPHPLLEPALRKTLGVPLFQEQLMQIAIDAAGFTPTEADRLRQAMAAKRSARRMEQLRERFFAGMARRGIRGGVAEAIWEKVVAFANYGFPQSHAVSFAYLVYASAWLKYHYPAAFLVALLNNQPMGFYSPASLVADARRHGVVVLGPDVNASEERATLEGEAVRLGLSYVRTLGEETAKRIAAGRPYACPEEVIRRNRLTAAQAEALATAGAFGCFGLGRREALWAAGALAQGGPGRLPGTVTGTRAPALAEMTPAERAAADLWATGLSPDSHPVQFVRPSLDRLGVVTASRLRELADRSRVLVAGIVTHRQRPSTAGGVVFVNLEDETGMINVVCSPGAWACHRRQALSSPALLVRGRLERADGAVNVVAERIWPLAVAVRTASRDFR